jgi:hypothetical protein
MMELVFFALLLCLPHALGQSLLQVLGTNLELSTLHYYVNRSVSLTTLLSTATNFTFLAPSNGAFANYFPTQGQNFTDLSDEEVLAILSYHMLQGIWQSATWSPTQAQFPTSYLTNTTYTNVTAGQAVELSMDGYGGRDILSWNKSASSIVTPVGSPSGHPVHTSPPFSNNLVGHYLHRRYHPDRQRFSGYTSDHGNLNFEAELQILCSWNGCAGNNDSRKL